MQKFTFRKSEILLFVYQQFLPLFFVLLAISSAKSQTNISGVVNAFSSVTANIAPTSAPYDSTSNNSFTVARKTLVEVADNALVIQQNDTDINRTNAVSDGSTTFINNSENYKFFEMASIATDNLNSRLSFTKQYFTSKK